MNSRLQQLHSRANSLIAMFQQGGKSCCIVEEAITLDREALKRCPPGHPMRSASLISLAMHLEDRYSLHMAMSDLDEAILLSREAVDLRPRGHRDRARSLNNLALYLSTRYTQLGTMQDLAEAIVLDREALDLRPQGHPKRSMSLYNLAIHLHARYKRLGTMQDLDEVIVLGREALALRPPASSDRLVTLTHLAGYLSDRYDQLGEMQDLNEAIVFCREALDLCPQGHPARSMPSNNLALFLSIRYKQLGEMQDLDEAIGLGQAALDMRPPGHPHRSTSLSNVALFLSYRYDQLGAMQDLDTAIVFCREALESCAQAHPDRSLYLNNLARFVSTRYKQLGAMSDLNNAIVFHREALDLRQNKHPDRWMSLKNLANCLHTRYKQLNAVQDLDMAIFLSREALALCPQGHQDRSAALNDLAACLYTRFHRLGDINDLDEAIVLDQEALDLRPQGHPDRSMSLNNLAGHLYSRLYQLEEIEDLNQAIILVREALDSRPNGHPERWMSLNNLASFLSTRYTLLETSEDLNEAVVLSQEALDLCFQGHPNRSASLNNLAGYLHDRFRQSKQLEDNDEMFRLYAQLADVTQGSSSDLSAARAWIDVAEHFRHPTLLLAYETSLRFLVQHLATLPSLPQHLTILKDLTSTLAVDAFSACLRNRSPTKAVELLEQGRGVFWSQLTRLRSPLEDIVATGPAGEILADEFSRLASLIRDTLNSSGTDQHEQVFRLNLEMQKIVTKIRELPGLSRFLLPSLFSDLQHAAKGGPVIIVNTSKYSCDAVIVLLDHDPVHIPLQITQEFVRGLTSELYSLTKRATRGDATRQLAFFLRRLWDQIVRPIVDFLQTTLSSQSRIWWCPTGEFSRLPLHAAGPFRKGEQNLSDLYISSYTPTLVALIRARQSNPSDFATDRKRFLAIGQGNAVGENELPSVGAELDTICQRISDLATFTRIEGEESSVGKVVEELGKNEWVHFSCHGLPNWTRPFESAFALHDGHFTIQQIIKCDLRNPEFAYLSACHTTVGYEESPDEVIHLASAMQFAGFRSVIGTMWAVDDSQTKKIVATFYKHMVDESGRLDHARAAYALNKTMKSVNLPFDQKILYIHIGV